MSPGLLRRCGVDLRYASLRGADLRDANLYGAELDFAFTAGADLTGANLLSVQSVCAWPEIARNLDAAAESYNVSVDVVCRYLLEEGSLPDAALRLQREVTRDVSE